MQLASCHQDVVLAFSDVLHARFLCLPWELLVLLPHLISIFLLSLPHFPTLSVHSGSLVHYVDPAKKIVHYFITKEPHISHKYIFKFLNINIKLICQFVSPLSLETEEQNPFKISTWNLCSSFENEVLNILQKEQFSGIKNCINCLQLYLWTNVCLFIFLLASI